MVALNESFIFERAEGVVLVKKSEEEKDLEVMVSH